MNETVYKEIVKTIKKYRGYTRNCYKFLIMKNRNVFHEIIRNVLFMEYRKRMKNKTYLTAYNFNKYFNAYIEGKSKLLPNGILLRLSKKFDISPCLISRFVLQKYYNADIFCSKKKRFRVNYYLKKTSRVMDGELSYEILLCILYDNQYGPMMDMGKCSLGQQYETHLNRQLNSLGIIFRDERYLRMCGYDKTPDVLLEIPIIIDGFIINWIESKAFFGTPEIHMDYTANQYMSYWNRFGSGLVIYWFGFLEIIQNTSQYFIIRDQFPINEYIQPTPRKVTFQSLHSSLYFQG